MNDAQRGRMEAFARDVLGCNCPKEVFDDIRVTPHPTEFSKCPAHAMITFGGRLMVLLLAEQPAQQVASNLPELFATGKRIRDRLGFNRFRLVLACAERVTETARFLNDRFQALPDLDDRLHLHVINTAQVHTLGI